MINEYDYESFDAVVEANNKTLKALDSYDETTPEQNSLVFSSKGELDSHNTNLVETTVRFLGDRTVISQIVQLLAYIRNGLKNNAKGNIDVKLGQTVANPNFMMDVNGFEVPDLVLQDQIQIN
nr:MAG TPA: hypothetical protein [Caudoviricetes sp.]